MTALRALSPLSPPPAPAASAGERPRPGPAGAPRLAWLDALRGVAALWVVYEHWGARVLPAAHAAVFSVFDPGLYGVLVFFLISGYIVPASLERRGSVRSFWVSRLFRLFPLFAVVIGITLALQLAGLPGVHRTSGDGLTAALSHLFMLNDVLGQQDLVVVIWTLTYEMVFYLLVTALFTTRQHGRSGGLAITMAGGALGLGGVLPTAWLSYHTAGPAAVAAAADVLVIGGLAAAVLGRGALRAAGAWLAALTGLTLVLLNGRRSGYEALTILALMFTGTLLYRARHGQAGRRRAAIISAGVFAAAMAAGAWHIPALTSSARPGLQQREWVVSVALAGLTFAAGLGLEHLRVPAGLAWLGRISYSVYLTFPLLLDCYDSITFPAGYARHPWAQAGMSAVFGACLVGCAAASYHLVEAPMQRLGRRAAAWLDARLGPDSAGPQPARQPGQRSSSAPIRRPAMASPAVPISARYSACQARPGPP